MTDKPYRPVWLEFERKNKADPFKPFRYGYKKYHYDRITGDIFDDDYQFTIGNCKEVIDDLAKKHHIPKILTGRIYKLLREKLSSEKLRDKRMKIFLSVMAETVPWIEQTEILAALTRAS